MTSPITPKDDELIERLNFDAKNIEFARSRPVASGYLSGREHVTMRQAASRIAELKAAHKAFVDNVADGLTWNSSQVQCLQRIESLVRDERRSALSNPPSGEVS